MRMPVRRASTICASAEGERLARREPAILASADGERSRTRRRNLLDRQSSWRFGGPARRGSPSGGGSTKSVSLSPALPA